MPTYGVDLDAELVTPTGAAIVSTVTRTERPRRTVTVETPYGRVRVKISEGPFGPPQVKPEFEDCAAAAKTHGVALREVIQAAL